MTVARSTSVRAAFGVALERYVDRPDEANLREAYEIGRFAIREGLGALDIALMFRDAAPVLIGGPQDPERLRTAVAFLVETLGPFEMTLRGYKDANTQLEALARRLEEQNRELVIAKNAIDAANRELEAFSYSVSHDLRAPVRHIGGFARLLREQCGSALPPTAAGHLDVIERSAQTMARMIEDLLNLSRLDRQGVVRRPVDLNQLVSDTIRAIEGDVTGRKIDWRVDALPIVECDPGLMQIVFTNLFSNAVKFTRHRADAVIQVGYRPDHSPSILFVKDNGAGFDPRYAHKLFAVFQRLHRSEEFEGTGVGLATVERIVRKHGGRIWAEGKPQEGATFSFTIGTPEGLPLAPPHEASFHDE